MKQPVCDGNKKENIEPIILKFEFIEQLFTAFHANKISYCHWKSNEHLGAGLSGETDLDLLFDESQKEQVCALMIEHGFKYFEAARQKRYHGIEDFLNIDFESGRFLHLHTHFKLTLGENYLKSYQLNLEQLVLESRVFDVKYQVYRAHPALELILLFIRLSFKLRMRDKVKIHLGKNLECAPNSVIEYNWLMERCTSSEVQYFLEKVFSNSDRVNEIILAGFNKKQLLLLSDIVRSEFSNHRIMNPIAALYERWKRELSLKFLRKYSKLTNEPVVVKRINPVDGLSIAIVGPDGSGKSTILNNLEDSFKRKLDVYSLYFGKGSGKMSWYRRLFVMLRYRKMVKKGNERTFKTAIATNTESHSKVKKRSNILNFLSITETLMVQWEKQSNYRLLKKAKKNGMLVICDRYPQNQVKGFNDGPSLHKYVSGKNRFTNSLVEREEKAYSFLQSNPPDIVFKLVADIDVIAARKPGETSIEMLRKKQDAFKSLTYPDTCKLVEVDANQPINNVLSFIRRIIWSEVR